AAPVEVRSFLRASVRDHARSHPEILRATSAPLPLLPGQTAGPRRAMTVEERIAEDEQLLWKKTCQQCHVIKSGTDLPQVAATQIPHRWFNKAGFDHQAHNIIECASCHSRAATSAETSDVLIPAIDSCRTCHTGQAGAQAAESRCFQCHSYHDWSKAKPTKGRFKIPELISGGTPHPPLTWPMNQ
ncbi:MAG: cytochrome c3 family protein, partial [Terriglobales bacterium]